MLTPARIKTICGKIAKGVPQGAAAASIGIPKRTFQNWLAAGRAEGAEGLYVELADGIDRAVARYHEGRAVKVHEHAEKDPRTAMFVLERRFPDDWGDHSKPGVNVSVNVQASPEWQELLRRVAAVLREQHPEALRTLAAEFGYRPDPPLMLESG